MPAAKKLQFSSSAAKAEARFSQSCQSAASHVVSRAGASHLVERATFRDKQLDPLLVSHQHRLLIGRKQGPSSWKAALLWFASRSLPSVSGINPVRIAASCSKTHLGERFELWTECREFAVRYLVRRRIVQVNQDIFQSFAARLHKF